MKWCTQDFFGFDDVSINIWNSWNNTLIICPDVPVNDGFFLADDGLEMITKNINIVFARCNSSRRICKN